MAPATLRLHARVSERTGCLTARVNRKCMARTLSAARSASCVAEFTRRRYAGDSPSAGRRSRALRRACSAQRDPAMVDASLDFWLTAGRFTEEFEAGLAELPRAPRRPVGQLRLVRQPRGALDADLAELKDRRIKPGDEVITVAAGFPTTVNPDHPEPRGAGVRGRRAGRPTRRRSRPSRRPSARRPGPS